MVLVVVAVVLSFGGGAMWYIIAVAVVAVVHGTIISILCYCCGCSCDMLC